MATPIQAEARDPVVLNALEVRPAPLVPATGALFVGTGSTPLLFRPNPDSLIYSTVGAGEPFSLIPAAASPGSITLIVAHLIASSALSLWVQLHRGNAEPAGGAIPELVPDVITAPGGNAFFQWAVSGVERATTGYVVVISGAQETYVDVNLANLRVRAYGQAP